MFHQLTLTETLTDALIREPITERVLNQSNFSFSGLH